jgi:hypothetical protein
MTQVTRTYALLTAAVLLLSRAAGAQTIDHSVGFTGQSDLQLNGSARAAGSTIALTDSTANGEHGSLFSLGKVNISQFSTTFQFQLLPGFGTTYGDGITFTIQNDSPQALGGTGSDLGYGGILNSLAVKFDTYLSSANGVSDPSANSTGVFTGGQSPIGGNDLSCCVTLRSHYMNALIEYDGTTLTLTLSDYTTATYFVWNWAINLPSLMGGSRTAYVGFTGGTGASYGTQQIDNWIWRSIAPMVAVDLQTLPNPCNANTYIEGNAINDLGQVVGQANACFDPSTPTQHAFIWDPVNLIRDLYTADNYLNQYYGVSSANSINVHGTVVGDSYTTVIADVIPPATQGVPRYLQSGFTWTAATGTMTAVQGPQTHVSCAGWQGGVPCSPGWSSFLRTLGVNDGGEIVGWMGDYAVAGYPHGMYDMKIAPYASPSWFTTPQVSSLSRANAINVNGLAVGDTGDGQSCALFDTTTNTQKPVSAGSSTTNQTLYAVNSSGYAVGQRDNTAIMWVPSTSNGMSGSFVDLITGVISGAKASGINDAGLVIETVDSYAAARLPSTAGARSGMEVGLQNMSDYGLITLPSGAPLGMLLYEGRAVNNLGQMVVTGSDKHAYLLTPAISPVLTSTSPSSMPVGSPAFTLTVNGSKFMYGSQVYWNGGAVPTTVVSPTQLTASITAADVARGGIDSVSVSNPVPNSPNATLLFWVH